MSLEPNVFLEGSLKGGLLKRGEGTSLVFRALELVLGSVSDRVATASAGSFPKRSLRGKPDGFVSNGTWSSQWGWCLFPVTTQEIVSFVFSRQDGKGDSLRPQPGG